MRDAQPTSGDRLPLRARETFVAPSPRRVRSRGQLAGAGNPRRREEELPVARRVRAWLVWWVALMSFWVVLDYSIAPAELLVGAGVAAMGAYLAELVQYQSDTHFRMRIKWALPALRLPGQVIRDTAIVFGALWRRLARRQEPDSGFLEVSTAWGEDTWAGDTRRVLLVGGTSVAPNTFALGIDREHAAMVVHRLVLPAEDAAAVRRPSGAKGERLRRRRDRHAARDDPVGRCRLAGHADGGGGGI